MNNFPKKKIFFSLFLNFLATYSCQNSSEWHFAGAYTSAPTLAQRFLSEKPASCTL